MIKVQGMGFNFSSTDKLIVYNFWPSFIASYSPLDYRGNIFQNCCTEPELDTSSNYIPNPSRLYSTSGSAIVNLPTGAYSGEGFGSQTFFNLVGFFGKKSQTTNPSSSSPRKISGYTPVSPVS